jgi:hypothetical protein
MHEEPLHHAQLMPESIIAPQRLQRTLRSSKHRPTPSGNQNIAARTPSGKKNPNWSILMKKTENDDAGKIIERLRDPHLTRRISSPVRGLAGDTPFRGGQEAARSQHERLNTTMHIRLVA